LKKNILIIGPFSAPITGNSLVNDKIFNKLPQESSFKVRKINTSYFEFDEETGKFSFSKFLFYLKLNFQLHKQFGVQIVYISIGQTFFGVLKNTFPMLLSKLLNQKLIIHLHGNELGFNYLNANNFQKKIFAFLLGLSDKAIVLSENLKHNMSHFIVEEKIEVLPNYVDNEIVASKKEINQKDYTRMKLFYLSNLMTKKGIFELLYSLKSLQQKGVFIHTELFGSIDKNIKTKILSLVDDLGNHVIYKGFANNLKKKNVFLANNVFILPSYIEGMPLAILEAMATGNIIITTHLPSLKDILIDGENCFLIPKKNHSEIENVLEKINTNLSLYTNKCKKNHEYVLKNFSEEAFIEKLCNIFNKP